MIIVEKKMKDAKEVSLKKNGTGMGIWYEGIDEDPGQGVTKSYWK